ncbi:Hypothetical protein AT6N2_L0547 [Agrobacterium tumefaciens]|nr:Hypothetical protein AT6N2_L0547 [Agrobacterium tumefaciens]
MVTKTVVPLAASAAAIFGTGGNMLRSVPIGGRRWLREANPHWLRDPHLARMVRNRRAGDVQVSSRPLMRERRMRLCPRHRFQRIQNHLVQSWLATVKIWLTGPAPSGRDADEHAIEAVIVGIHRGNMVRVA